MKRYFSIFLSVSILFSLLAFAGLGGVFATDTISITADKTVLVVGQTATLTVTLPNGAENISVDIDDESVIVFDPVSSTSTIRALKYGSAIITATCTVNGTSYTDSVTIKVRTPRGLISGEDYYLMNLQTGKFLAIPSGGDYNGVTLRGVTRCSATYAQWTAEIAENGNGVTRLINASSSTGRALYVDSTSDVVLYSSTSTTVRSQIALHRVESGTYQGKYLMRYNGKFISMNSSNDVYLANSLNAGSYWTFMAVEKGYADLISFNYPEDGFSDYFDTTANNALFETVMSNKGYFVYASINTRAEDAYNYLTSGDIFIFRGHGNPSMICFYDSSGNKNGYILSYKNVPLTEAYYVNQLPDNSLALQRCVLYLGCNTGVSKQSYNLVQETFDKGAHFVVGTTQTTYVGDSNNFLQGFLNALNNETPQTLLQCIQEGISEAQTKDYYVSENNTSGQYPIYYIGDSNQYLD